MNNSENGQFDNLFLLDEVRCGFYIPTEIKQAWATQLEVLQAVDAVCRANNIKYFADWGTLLGAVRHRGFIPWDDDIDIVMKREDYEHFRQVESQLPAGYSIHTFRNEEGFREFHATVVGAPSVSFEAEHLRKFHGFPYMCGLDIFILDYVYADEKKEEERIHNIKYVIGIADAIEDGTSPESTIEYGLAEIEKKLKIRLDRKRDKHEMWIYLYELAEKLCAEVKPEEAKELTQMIPWGILGKGFRFPKELYKDSIYVPFEYTYIPVPPAYDAMLTKRYGSYLKLVKSAGGHEYPFFRAQKDRLQALLDFDMPGFRYTEEIARCLTENRASDNKSTESTRVSEGEKAESWKSIVREAVAEWTELIENLNVMMHGETITVDILSECLQITADAQQLIIDIINLIEAVKGEGAIDTQPVENCCELLFNIYNQINDSGVINSEIPDNEVLNKGFLVVQSLDNILAELKVTVNQIVNSIDEITGRREVVFVAMGADKWSGYAALYEKEKATNNTDVYVIPMPVIFKDYDGSPMVEHLDTEDYPKGIALIDYANYQPELHRPDRIYIQSSFDAYNPAYTVPKEYYSLNLRKNTDELIYVPWMNEAPFEITDRAYSNLEYHVTMPGLVNADKVILTDSTVAERYIQKLVEWSENSAENLWREKISIIDKESKASCETTVKQLLYFIGTSQLLAAGEDYFVKMRANLDIFAASSDKIEVTVVENGGLKEAVSKLAPELIRELTQIKDEYVSKGINWLVDDNSNDLKFSHSVDAYTAYYGDAGYLVPEFVLRGKPVMIQQVISDMMVQ